MKPFEVLYEDNHLIAVNKAAGVLVQGDKTGDEPLSELVKKFLKDKYKKPGNVFCGVIHRLDRPVSGLVVLAKTSKGLERMNGIFQDKKIKKTYVALVKEKPPQDEARLTHWLVKDHFKNTTKAYENGKKGGKLADLSYKILGKVHKYYMLEVNPMSGRPHQIRAQLAKIGCPIKGDIKYGYPEKNKDGSIHLHAFQLEFEHPVKKEPVRLSASLPKDQTWNDYKHLLDEI
ncbi:MAG: RluA family pseudouridine synthase [Flammeovirgaceae bacterium]|nr:RluA family pseudouridine synthase [Flammeovirgaceae bacterium]